MKIPKHWLTVTTSKSSGPGGQNVNKVNTKVDMRLDLKWIPNDIVQKIRDITPSRINKYHQLFASSDSSRSQAENYSNCFMKLQEIIDKASIEPIIKDNSEKKEIIRGHMEKFNKKKQKEKSMNSIKKFFRRNQRDETDW